MINSQKLLHNFAIDQTHAKREQKRHFGCLFLVFLHHHIKPHFGDAVEAKQLQDRDRK